MPAGSPSRLWLLGLVCLLLLGLSLWLGQRLLDNQDQRLFAPANCSSEALRQGCSAEQGQRQIELQLVADSISAHTPLDFQVRLNGYQAERVEIELQGRDMYMGQLRFELEPNGVDRYLGQSMLPACTTGKMIWRASVWVTEQGQLSGSWFDFEVE